VTSTLGHESSDGYRSTAPELPRLAAASDRFGYGEAAAWSLLIASVP
jgi:hypothetical protein